MLIQSLFLVLCLMRSQASYVHLKPTDTKFVTLHRPIAQIAEMVQDLSQLYKCAANHSSVQA